MLIDGGRSNLKIKLHKLFNRFYKSFRFLVKLKEILRFVIKDWSFTFFFIEFNLMKIKIKTSQDEIKQGIRNNSRSFFSFPGGFSTSEIYSTWSYFMTDCNKNKFSKKNSS